MNFSIMLFFWGGKELLTDRGKMLGSRSAGQGLGLLSAEQRCCSWKHPFSGCAVCLPDWCLSAASLQVAGVGPMSRLPNCGAGAGSACGGGGGAPRELATIIQRIEEQYWIEVGFFNEYFARLGMKMFTILAEMASAYSWWIRRVGVAYSAAVAWRPAFHRRRVGAKSVPCWPMETWEHGWETSGKRQVWTCGREKRRGGSRLESPFPTVLPPPVWDEAGMAQPAPGNICTWCKETLLVMHGLVGVFFFFVFFFSSRPIHLSNVFSARNHHLGRSLYWRSSQLTLALVSEIVWLLLQGTPKIATEPGRHLVKSPFLIAALGWSFLWEFKE